MSSGSVFLVRVFLHHADSSLIYDLIHEQMEDSRFKRTINGDDGVVYDLPNAEYLYESLSVNVKPQSVFNKASQAIDRCIEAVNEKIEYSLVVTNADSILWKGLKKSQSSVEPNMATIVMKAIKRIELSDKKR